MNKLNTLILTAGVLALAACSGKGSADASPVKAEDLVIPDQGGKLSNPENNSGAYSGETVLCDFTESDEGKTYHLLCGEMPSQYCQRSKGTVVNSCSEDYLTTCSINGASFYTYLSAVTCDIIKEGLAELQAATSSEVTDEDGTESNSSSGATISDLCGAGMYTEIPCTGSSNTWFACFTGEYYSCSSNEFNCQKKSESDIINACSGSMMESKDEDW